MVGQPNTISGQLAPFSQIEIALTKGYVAYVDAIDADLVNYKWQAAEDKLTVYAIRTVWHSDGSRETVRLHRVVLARSLQLTLDPAQKVDHENGNGLDNRRCNLRLATSTQNARNRAIQRNSKSGVRGVSWHEATHKWRARIMVHGVSIELGYFDQIEDAATARQEGELQYFGEFSAVKSRLS